MQHHLGFKMFGENKMHAPMKAEHRKQGYVRTARSNILPFKKNSINEVLLQVGYNYNYNYKA
jgi:hypothetical protein